MENIKMDDLAVKARNYNDSICSQLDGISRSADRILDGKNRGKIVIQLIVRIVWFAVAVIAIVVAHNLANTEYSLWMGYLMAPYLPLFALAPTAVFFILLIVDAARQNSYYGKILNSKKSAKELQNRLKMGSDAILSDQIKFTDSAKNNWNYPLQRPNSILGKMEDIQKDISTMGALKTGALSKVINVFFFITLAVLAIYFSYSMFNAGSTILLLWEKWNGNEAAYTVCNVICLLATTGATIFLGRLWWAKTASVTNLNLIMLFAPIVLFPALMFLGMCVAEIFILILALIGVAIAIACACFCCSGG